MRRTFLGGLIALSVYILLLGGTSVVGGAAGIEDGQSNFLTFSAMGILAGMFSDRAAGWLSRRADAFFTDTRPEAN